MACETGKSNQIGQAAGSGGVPAQNDGDRHRAQAVFVRYLQSGQIRPFTPDFINAVEGRERFSTTRANRVETIYYELLRAAEDAGQLSDVQIRSGLRGRGYRRYRIDCLLQQAHTMRQDEFVRRALAISRAKPAGTLAAMHAEAVSKAVQSGLAVPMHVLADYPDFSALASGRIKNALPPDLEFLADHISQYPDRAAYRQAVVELVSQPFAEYQRRSAAGDDVTDAARALVASIRQAYGFSPQDIAQGKTPSQGARVSRLWNSLLIVNLEYAGRCVARSAEELADAILDVIPAKYQRMLFDRRGKTRRPPRLSDQASADAQDLSYNARYVELRLLNGESIEMETFLKHPELIAKYGI